MTIYVINILLFFFYCYGIGTIFTLFLKSSNIETVVMRSGIGLAAIPLLGVLMNYVGIPLHWLIFFLIASIGILIDSLPVFSVRKRGFPAEEIRLPKEVIVILLICFLFCCAMYIGGAFTYPWLENDDSWNHAAGIKYVAVEKNVTTSPGFFQYINPYPPGYDILIGLMHQTSPSLYWTLKFFNALIVSLGTLYFFFFVLALTKNDKFALWSTILLTAIPCYLSHFIWAHSLVITLLPVALYVVIMTKKSARYSLSAVTVWTGILLSQPTQPIKFAFLFLFLLISFLLSERKLPLRLLLIPILVLVLTAIWYMPITRSIAQGDMNLHTTSGTSGIHSFGKAQHVIQGIFDPEGGSTTRAFSMDDYLFPPRYNDRNSPYGIGLILTLLALSGIVISYRKYPRTDEEQQGAMLLMSFWLVFAFLGLNTKTFRLPIGLFAYRFWPLLAIPVCFFAAQAAVAFTAKQHKHALARTIMILLAVGITSAYPKFVTNSYAWAWGVYWKSADEMKGYLWMKDNLKPNSKVYAFVDNKFVIGHDMHSDYWNPHYQKSFQKPLSIPVDQLYLKLKQLKFSYVVIDARAVNHFGKKEIMTKARELLASPLFKLVHKEDQDFLLFSLK